MLNSLKYMSTSRLIYTICGCCTCSLLGLAALDGRLELHGRSLRRSELGLHLLQRRRLRALLGVESSLNLRRCLCDCLQLSLDVAHADLRGLLLTASRLTQERHHVILANLDANIAELGLQKLLLLLG